MPPNPLEPCDASVACYGTKITRQERNRSAASTALPSVKMTPTTSLLGG